MMNRKYVFAFAVVAGLLVSGCSQETKEHAKETAQSAAKDTAAAVQTAKEKSAEALKQAQAKASEAMDQAKKAAAEAVEKAKESAAKMEEAAKAKTAEAAAVVEKKAADVKKSMAGEAKAPAADGVALFAKCAGCHGADGKMKALGKSPAIAGEPAAEIAKKLKEYKAGKRNAYGMGGVMQGQAAGLSESDIAALADYISKLK